MVKEKNLRAPPVKGRREKSKTSKKKTVDIRKVANAHHLGRGKVKNRKVDTVSLGFGRGEAQKKQRGDEKKQPTPAAHKWEGDKQG